MNEQAKMKQNLSLDGISKPLQLSEIFYSIQGEGPNVGRPAVFIRLAGCNLQCHWCDTDYSIKMDAEHNKYNIDILKEAVMLRNTHGVSLIIITGGEPFRQNIVGLIDLLLDYNFEIQIETSGSLSNPGMPWYGVTVVCSPKTGKLHPDMIHVNHWKYVISSVGVDTDGLPMESTQIPHKIAKIAKPMNQAQIYLSPCYDDDPKEYQLNVTKVVALALEHGHRISLQTHKLLKVR